MADVDIRIRTIDQTGNGIRSIESKLKGFVSTIGTVTAGATVMAGVFKKAFDFAEQGAQLEFIETKFGRLAASIGSDSGTILAALTEVTRGTMTTAQMMDTASQIISLGLGKNEEDVVRLASLVTNLGWDMQQVILTFANDSKMRLDALGLSVEDVTRRAAEFEKAGYDASRAFDLAVLAAGEDKLNLVGSAADSSAGAYLRLKVQIQETTDAWKEQLAEGITPVVQALNNDYGRAIETTIQGQIDQAQSMEEMIALAARLSQGMEGMGDNITGTSQEMAAGLEEVLKRIARNTSGWEEYRRALYEAGITGNEATEIFWREIEALVELDRQTGMAEQRAEQFALQQQMVAREQAAVEESTRATSGAYDHMIGVAIALNEEMEEYGSTLPGINAALDTLRERMMRVAEYTGQAFTEQMNAERGAGLLTQAISDLGQHWVQVNGRTQQQNEDLERIQDAYDRVTDQIHDYEIGLRGAGMEEDERAEAMQALYDEAARLQGIMQPLVDITGEYHEVTVRATFSGEAAASMLYDMAGSARADAYEMAELGVALGTISPQMAEAALQSALLQAKISGVAAAFAEGKIKASEARDMVAQFVDELNGATGTTDEAANSLAESMEKPARAARELHDRAQEAAGVLTSFPKTVSVDFIWNVPPIPQVPGVPASGAGVEPVPLSEGGVITGGIPGRDSVPALLMPGERVLSVEQNKAYEQGMTGGGGVTIMPGAIQIVNPTASPAAIAAEVMHRIARETRRTVQAGGAYIGN